MAFFLSCCLLLMLSAIPNVCDFPTVHHHHHQDEPTKNKRRHMLHVREYLWDTLRQRQRDLSLFDVTALGFFVAFASLSLRSPTRRTIKNLWKQQNLNPRAINQTAEMSITGLESRIPVGSPLLPVIKIACSASCTIDDMKLFALHGGGAKVLMFQLVQAISLAGISIEIQCTSKREIGQAAAANS